MRGRYACQEEQNFQTWHRIATDLEQWSDWDFREEGKVEAWGGEEMSVGAVQGALPRERHNGHCLTTLGRGRRHRTKRRSLAVKRPMQPPSCPKTSPFPPSAIPKLSSVSTRHPFCLPMPIKPSSVSTRCRFRSRRYTRFARYDRRVPGMTKLGPVFTGSLFAVTDSGSSSAGIPQSCMAALKR